MSTIVLSSCVIMVLVLAALLRNFWQLRRSLEFARKYDATIREDRREGRYESLPIYNYIFCHVHIVIVASIAIILLINAVLVIFPIFCAERQFQLSSFLDLLEVVPNLLTVLLGIHTVLIACYESTNPERRKVNEVNIQAGLKEFRVRLWGSALRLFAFIVFMMMARAIFLVFASTEELRG